MAIPTLCPFALLSGQPCPGCGMGRSLWYCLNGELGRAFILHPLGPLVFLCGLVLGALWLSSLSSDAGRRAFAATVQWGRCTPVWRGALTLTLCLWLARFGGMFGGPVPVHTPLTQLIRAVFGCTECG